MQNAINSLYSNLPKVSDYTPNFSGYVPKPVSDLAGTINRLGSSLLKLGVDIHSDLRPFSRAIAIASKSMQLFELGMHSTRFGQAIKVLDTAYTVLDTFHLGDAIHYLTTERKEIKKLSGHLIGVAFGLVAVNEVIGFASNHGLFSLSSLVLSYGQTTLLSVCRGDLTTAGVVVGFGAWTYSAGSKYLKERKQNQNNSWDEQLKSAWKSKAVNTAVWAASELGLFVIPMAVSVPTYALLPFGIVIKAMGIRSHLLPKPVVNE